MLRYRLLLGEIFYVTTNILAVAGWVLLGLLIGLGVTGTLDDVIMFLTEV